ncbi:hypothetical protein RR42_m1930 [Cupriavidus basilensis]|uniref:Uncharacterized protein n=1 Tax=Cupriavidus basilensis TaxID=68895 RepID=A0A0C4Y8L7_9BURK|nr:hypothetical protein RR42_m1930 [Cupriavidus basilensis]
MQPQAEPCAFADQRQANVNQARKMVGRALTACTRLAGAACATARG